MTNSRSNLAEQVKSRLSSRAVAEAYGHYPNRAGFILCPFHGEKTASLKFFDDTGRWKCFGCNAGGDCIDFVRLLFGLNVSAAILRLNSDFNLGLTAGRPDPRETARIERERATRAAAEAAYNAEQQRVILEYRRLHHARIHKAPQSPDEPFDEEYIEALLRLARLDYWFETHPARYTDYVRGDIHRKL